MDILYFGLMLPAVDKMRHLNKMNNKTLNKNLPGLDQEYSSFLDVIEQFGVIKKFQNNLYRLTGLSFDFLDIGQRHSRKLQAQRVFMPFCRMINDTPLG